MNNTISMSRTQEEPRLLVLPHQHPLSLRIAAQSDLIFSQSLPPPQGVIQSTVLSPGLVEVILQTQKQHSNKIRNSYSSRSWPIRVGGAGLGDDDPMMIRLGGDPRAPIAVRFAVPISLDGVDDAGFCDASFFTAWATGAEELTLQSICDKAISWLEGRHLIHSPIDDDADDDGEELELLERRRERWIKAEEHMANRLDVIRRYQDIVETSEEDTMSNSFLSNTASSRILPEWVVSAFHSCFKLSETIVCVPSTSTFQSLVTKVGPGIYAFELFTPAFCDLLVKEIDFFEASGLPCRRPNTMNRLGLVVNDIGFEPLMTDLLERLIAPMCQALYPDEIHTTALDHHHSFVVRYRNDSSFKQEDGNKGLDMHHDASEATLNVCLGRDLLPGGGLRFCGRNGDRNHRLNSVVHSHTKGWAVLHLGRHRHGADDIEGGERMNLIVWARNSAFRGAAAFGHVPLDGSPIEKQVGAPDLLCLSKANDGDYEEQIKRFDGNKHKI
jgi:hypothetical protein